MPRVLRADRRCVKHKMRSDATGYSICLECGFYVDAVPPKPPSEKQHIDFCAECDHLAPLFYVRKGTLVRWLCAKCEEGEG